jgi:hypothetical protein
MDEEGGTTILKRISILEGTVAQVQRERSVASLAFLVIEATGNAAEYAAIRARLVALGIVIDAALEELADLYEEQAEERDGGETR